jgi:hypothetical protein
LLANSSGQGDKTLTWINSTNAWTASEDFNLVTGKSYEIGGALVANSTTLGSTLVNSSLTSVGTISTGVWQGSVISAAYGGTGQSTYSNGQILIGNNSGGLTKTTITAGDNISVTNGDGSITIAVTGVNAITNTEIVDAAHVTGRLVTGQAFVYGVGQLTTLQQVTSRGATTANAISITNNTASGNAVSGALVVTGGLGVNNNIYAGGRIGWSNSSNISVAYEYYNPVTNSIDTVFG